MLTTKQSGYYAILTYPFLAISIGLLIQPIIKILLEKISRKSILTIGYITVICLSISIVQLSLQPTNRLSIKQQILDDTKKIIKKVGNNTTIGLPPNLHNNWVLYAYFSRYGNVSLDSKPIQNHEYIINKKDNRKVTIKDTYQLLDINTKNITLYKKSNSFLLNLKKKLKDYLH